MTFNDRDFPPTLRWGEERHRHTVTNLFSIDRKRTLKRQITIVENGRGVGGAFRSTEKNLDTKRGLDTFLNRKGGKWSSNVNRKVYFPMQTEMLQTYES